MEQDDEKLNGSKCERLKEKNVHRTFTFPGRRRQPLPRFEKNKKYENEEMKQNRMNFIVTDECMKDPFAKLLVNYLQNRE